jgi:hypothetical protein
MSNSLGYDGPDQLELESRQYIKTRSVLSATSTFELPFAKYLPNLKRHESAKEQMQRAG